MAAIPHLFRTFAAANTASGRNEGLMPERPLASQTFSLMKQAKLLFALLGLLVSPSLLGQSYANLPFIDSGPIRYGIKSSTAPSMEEAVVLRLLNKNLTSVEIPYNVSRHLHNYTIEVIAEGAFSESSLEEVKLSDAIKFIEAEAFKNCPLKRFVCPAKLRHIGRMAFAWCTELEEVETDNNLKAVGPNAFRSCTKLRRFDCPPDMHTIGDYAFYCCSSLERVTLGKDMINIGVGAFDATWNLKLIVCQNPNPHPAKDAFCRDVLQNALLVVPDGCAAKYRATEGWSGFAHIMERSQVERE